MAYGYAFDPDKKDDIKRDDEYSSDDFPSDEEHEFAYGDSSSDGTDTEGEGQLCPAR